ncbi:MAG TPA: hypothetical protein VJ521_14525 [Acidobacteriota bacterium]|nr:hypothetical protein [Acidobacteriota bacterium]
MIPFDLFMNLLLLVIGVALIVILFSGERHDEQSLRAIFFGYFLVVLQYNYDRVFLFRDKFLLVAAALCFLIWVWRPAMAEESAAE